MTLEAGNNLIIEKTLIFFSDFHLYDQRIVFDGSCTVTLVVASAFLFHNFWRWRVPMNSFLSFNHCRLSGGDTERW